MIKKYFSLAEISMILNQPMHKIRYLEKSKNIGCYKLNNRNYFSVDDIENLSLIFNNKMITMQYIQNSLCKIKIDNLMKKFQKLL